MDRRRRHARVRARRGDRRPCRDASSVAHAGGRRGLRPGANAAARGVAIGASRSRGRTCGRCRRTNAANPGMLWVQRGGESWDGGGARWSCASCPSTMRRRRCVAWLARHRRLTKSSGEVVDLESRINAAARSASTHRRGRATRSDLLALSTYIAYQSRGMPMAVRIDGPARAWSTAVRRAPHQARADEPRVRAVPRPAGQATSRREHQPGARQRFLADRLEWQRSIAAAAHPRLLFRHSPRKCHPPGARELTGPRTLSRVAGARAADSKRQACGADRQRAPSRNKRNKSGRPGERVAARIRVPILQACTRQASEESRTPQWEMSMQPHRHCARSEPHRTRRHGASARSRCCTLHRGDPPPRSNRVLADDPGCVVGHCLRAALAGTGR